MGEDDRKLFVGRLPDDIREDEIHMVFSTYGRVENVKILDKGAQKAAFVTYDTKYGADTAVSVLNNVYRFRTDARDPVHVSHARAGGGGGDVQAPSKPASAPGPVPPAGGTFGGFGYPPAGYGYPPSGYPGFGYDQSAYGRYQPPPTGGGGNSAKIYVANLPEDINKESLEYVFRTYGHLKDVHIMSGRSKSGRLAAFILYSDPEEARKCVAAMQAGYEIRPGQGDIQVKYASDQRPPNSGPRDKPF
jgi:RNA recognition motif-containing protein